MVVDKDKVEKQAKQILDKFAKALEKVEKECKSVYSSVDRDEFEREEGSGEECNFKKKLLENAPEKSEDFIIVERGSWK